ncbi:hypothetical protein KIN34_14420 [Cellulomonas sp. DKR-3]|uniref:Uncharacterized protein n=1 Tax=Cellulomonas fulva TaxID=2835530 RepID=A0ABS5U250_9CELL|nr:hypothetical protein [Cellulomonas fulva]MBT0995478.1 hypothetical protein [Cellulomonas fulva]
MTDSQDLDGLLDAATRLARRQAEWGGVDLGDERVVGWTATFLGLVSEEWDEAHIQKFIDAFGAVSMPLPDDPRAVLWSIVRRP